MNFHMMTQLGPIEVKSGTNSHLRSIHSFVYTAENRVTAVRVWSGGVYCSRDGNTIPL